jgi:hypothetical protein
LVNILLKLLCSGRGKHSSNSNGCEDLILSRRTTLETPMKSWTLNRHGAFDFSHPKTVRVIHHIQYFSLQNRSPFRKVWQIVSSFNVDVFGTFSIDHAFGTSPSFHFLRFGSFFHTLLTSLITV